ncbi:hypothetical protein I8752_18000 [Nostocaceae cyanobacterium CENA369]|uniref:Lipoprotein n=2 Tax=Dendronalium TaxID=2840442 RepID=A0A8J7I882_9NOST|nr:hypothetical protein [Dendronalium phyllosphericum]MBH8574880.1 hypothetical protein [Dendronalium phyllosphericum CENA369]
MQLIQRHLYFLLLLLLLTACGSKSTKDELSKELQSVKSWTATAHFVGDAWIHKAVPTTYVKQTLDKTQQELKTQTEELSKLSIPSSNRGAILKSLQQLQDTVSQMSKAVENNNYPAVTQQVQQLSHQEQAIAQLSLAAGGQP